MKPRFVQFHSIITMPTYNHWCWTLNNWTMDEFTSIRGLGVNPLVRYVCFQREEVGTPHLQGYLELHEKQALRVIRELPGMGRAHFEHRRGTRDEARDYTRKEGEGVIPDSWEEYGTWISGAGARTDIADMVQRVRAGAGDAELLDEMPGMFIRHHKAITAARAALVKPRDPASPPVVKVMWGATGTGKTRYAYEYARDHNKSIYFQSMGKWWDGYTGQDVVCIDDFTQDKAKEWGIGYMLQLLDRYPMRVQNKGGSVEFNSPTIFITSNLAVEEWFPGAIPAHVAALRRRITDVLEFQPAPVPPALPEHDFNAWSMEWPMVMPAQEPPPIYIDLTEDGEDM